MRKAEGAQFLQWYGPILDALRVLGGSGTPDEVVDRIAATLKIPDKQLNETIRSGGSRFKNQVAFARLYLSFEGLLDSSRRGVWSLTEKGRATELTVADARAIFQRWVKIHSAKRKEHRRLEKPAEEQGVEGSELPCWIYSVLSRRKALSDSHSACCGSRASHR
jgi:restriction system protein